MCLEIRKFGLADCFDCAVVVDYIVVDCTVVDCTVVDCTVVVDYIVVGDIVVDDIVADYNVVDCIGEALAYFDHTLVVHAFVDYYTSVGHIAD